MLSEPIGANVLCNVIYVNTPTPPKLQLNGKQIYLNLTASKVDKYMFMIIYSLVFIRMVPVLVEFRAYLWSLYFLHCLYWSM